MSSSVVSISGGSGIARSRSSNTTIGTGPGTAWPVGIASGRRPPAAQHNRNTDFLTFLKQVAKAYPRKRLYRAPARPATFVTKIHER